ncbi:sensor histidine kinase [Reticulibacter mediterranei]|uniref:sensor histidine kinase n=1 Tax=Reticulibacter mediterranei TaxID=2778369 RepID=UPI001C6885A2|nr:ATP-binding protein [Reticulibacter mediterranei]
MSLKNNLQPSQSEHTPKPEGKQPGSLRLQLMIWYGGLVAVLLTLFAFLVLYLSTQTLYANANQAMNTVAAVVVNNVRHELVPQEPYWPPSLSLKAIDTYNEPGISVAVLDLNGKFRYTSDSALTPIPKNANVIREAQTVGRSGEYVGIVDGERVKVEVMPVSSPHGEAIIGVVLVAKSLKEVDETVVGLHVLIITLGLVVFVVGLVGGWAITANVLRPLAGITKTARNIVATVHGTHVGSLSQRVQRPRGHDEMVQVIDTFNEMLDSLESATKAQRRFIADASHELRAPLTSVQGNLAFLQRYLDDMPTEERRAVLNGAYEDTLRLARLVDELLLLARADASSDTVAIVDANKEVPEKKAGEIIELDHTLLQLIRQLRGRLSLDKSQLKLEVGHIEPVRVRGDEESIRRIMLILLDNAIKYTQGKGEVGLITVSVERKQNEGVFHVQDTGIGIDPGDLPHIFERFYRADRARSQHGTGLGLSIAHTLAEQLGGRITAESVPGEGSTFSVWLPLARSQQ